MHLVHPIKPEECRSLTGMYVCAVLQDGNRYYGILSRVDSGKLYLNESAVGDNLISPIKNAGANSKTKTTARARSKIKGKKKANISAKVLTKQTLKMVNDLNSVDGDLFDNTFTDHHTYDQPAPYSQFGSKTVLDLGTIEYLFPIMF